ncbi:DNA mismatch repair protein MutL [Halalkaliarchaeum desulfuricum]|uniref:DNA mismatch repair protein MutL n=1 Tax=Halalkaliarchaeum desulfuricum TaxID=2055893 RepID=A0A343TFP5_9EURY|nr:DNA mismatch repair endonuclease MutL [Halalkaliarchaeum desulfuricum]AUX07917.1 DNA mismatch repair protein MutL [Halalkaliarchaeum desulfuricum]
MSDEATENGVEPSRVRELDADTVERIAAGEVITRPARVVAELVENALDAGASRIEITVDGDGTDRGNAGTRGDHGRQGRDDTRHGRIRVADDGRGMSRRDAELAVEPHTTSKLGTAADLRRIDTLGFRGEALAAVAESATLDIVTNDGGDRGTRVLVERGDETVADAGRGRGTTVEVTDLFADRPARLASLADPGTEFSRISTLVADYALARPDVAVSLVHDGRETLSTNGDGVRGALLSVYGKEVARRAIELDRTVELDVEDVEQVAPDDESREGSIECRIQGAIVPPVETRASRGATRIAIGDRPVSNEELARAVESGYGTLLPDGRHPIVAIDVGLPSRLVDANVHPAKRRVALSVSGAVESAVETVVSEALETADVERAAAAPTDLATPLAAEGTADAAGPAASLAGAEVIGQYRELYLLCELDGDLIVVDGHAAHERVNYERLRAALSGEAIPQRDLEPPATVSLDPGHPSVFEANEETIRELGFDAESFGGNLLRVRAVPAPLGREADPDVLCDVLDRLAGGGDPDRRRDRLLRDLACHPSLKAGQTLTDSAANALLNRLAECAEPYACPHGRPTLLRIEEATLAREFDREQTRFG